MARARRLATVVMSLAASLGSVGVPGAAAIPPYARPSSAQLIIGSAFLSPTTGWIALSRSGAYVPNGSCSHGVGTNCGTAQTVIYSTGDAGAHWRRLLSVTTAGGPLVWIRLFNPSEGLIAADVGAPERGMVFDTSNGGRTWVRFPLPSHYLPDPPTITFPDPRHGWLYIGDGAMGSMGVTMFTTANGGKRWAQVACTQVPATPQPCHTNSGIGFGGDKTFLTFDTPQSGWLGVYSNAGIPSLLQSPDGGRTWHYQHIALPPDVQWPGPSSSVYSIGDYDRPAIFGRVGLLAESVHFYRSRPSVTWSHLYVYRSTDAGRSWRFYQRAPLPSPSISQYASAQGPQAQFLDTRHWIAVVGNTIWRTANAGRIWSHAAMRLPAGLQLQSFSFTDPAHGWAEAVPAGQIGTSLGSTTLLRTSDGGLHWLRVAIPSVPAYAVIARSASAMVASAIRIEAASIRRPSRLIAPTPAWPAST